MRMETKKKSYREYVQSDFLRLDDELFPLLGESEKNGEHLKLLFTFTHSKLFKGKTYEEGDFDMMKAFSFLLEHKDEEINTAFILSLFAYSSGQKGQWKTRNSYFDDGKSFYITCSKEKTPSEMEALCKEYAFLNHPAPNDFDRIFEFVLRFVCIHPFLDGNGRMSAALLQAFLYKAGLKCAFYLPIDPLMSGLYGHATSREIRFASGVYYQMKPFDYSSYVPYLKGILYPAYTLLMDTLKRDPKANGKRL